MAEGYDPRGAMPGAARRTLGGLAPPVRPSLPAPPLRAPEPPGTVPAQAPPSRTSARAGRDDEIIGFPRGRLRQIQLYLSGPAAEFLEQTQRRTRFPRGVLMMQAVRRTYAEILSEYELPNTDSPGLFGPVRPVERRRQEVPDPVHVSASITEEEARGLTTVRTRTGLSASAIVSDALERVRRREEHTGIEFPGTS